MDFNLRLPDQLMTLNIFACAYVPSVNLFWWSICSNILPGGLFSYYCVLRILYIFWIQVALCGVGSGISFSACGLAFHYLSYVLCASFWWCSIYRFSPLHRSCMLPLLSPRTLCQTQGHREVLFCVYVQSLSRVQNLGALLFIYLCIQLW